MFFDEYSKLTNQCAISKLGEIFSYYYADNINVRQFLARDCIEIDIRSAFPTICRIMFGEEDAFVKKIFKIKDKFERNKFISIKLNKQSKSDNREYLKELVNFSKFIIFGKVFNNYENINILEYKKDGILFNGDILKYPIYDKVEQYIINNKITFKENKVKTYIRINKNTSIYEYESGNIIIKGTFKNCPLFIQEEILPTIIKDNKIYDNVFTNIIKTRYSKKTLEIMIHNNLVNQIKYHYGFNKEDKTKTEFIDSNGKFTNKISDIDPNRLLIDFLYPIILLLRSEK